MAKIEIKIDSNVISKSGYLGSVEFKFEAEQDVVNKLLDIIDENCHVHKKVNET